MSDVQEKFVHELQWKLDKLDNQLRDMNGRLEAMFAKMSAFIDEHAPVEVTGPPEVVHEERMYMGLPVARVVKR